MILRLLQLLLILAVVRAVWRLAKGVLEGAGYARVEAVKNEILSPSGGLWIDESALDPRGE